MSADMFFFSNGSGLTYLFIISMLPFFDGTENWKLFVQKQKLVDQA